MLTWNLCDYGNAYIVVKGRISGTNDANKKNKKLSFNNNAPFRTCISKINNTFVDNAEDLDIVMPMYNHIVTIFLWHQEVCGINTEVK